MFVRLKTNLRFQSDSEPRQFFYGRGGFITLMPGELTSHSSEILKFFAENHLDKVDFVDSEGNIINLLNENNELDLSKLDGFVPPVKEIDFGGEKVKSKKMKTDADKSEVNKLIFGDGTNPHEVENEK